jgi:hypothetical protein
MPTPRLPLDERQDEVTEVLLVLRQVLREPAFATALIQLVTGNGPKLGERQSEGDRPLKTDFYANVESQDGSK